TSITKGTNISEPGIPESFRVLVREMRSLGLDVCALGENGQEIPDTIEDVSATDMARDTADSVNEVDVDSIFDSDKDTVTTDDNDDLADALGSLFGATEDFAEEEDGDLGDLADFGNLFGDDNDGDDK
ncbi:MAG: DNA-directed RNA polymerase subunit beta, partial [Clostridia bacterium]|nr:DNA-directed RNA polymerase subunit beta [Clostridia bacterium]